jgi:hypothetical protein
MEKATNTESDMVLVFAPMDSTTKFLDEHSDGYVPLQNFVQLEIFSKSLKVEHDVHNTVYICTYKLHHVISLLTLK